MEEYGSVKIRIFRFLVTIALITKGRIFFVGCLREKIFSRFYANEFIFKITEKMVIAHLF